MSTGERIRLLRKELDMTLEKFGECLGVTKITISRIEREVNSLTDQMAKSICREFNVNEEWLRSGEGDMFNKKKTDELDALLERHGLDDLEAKAVKAYMGIDESVRRQALEQFLQIWRTLETQDTSDPDKEIRELEEAYKKSRLEIARKEASSVLNTGGVKEVINCYK